MYTKIFRYQILEKDYSVWLQLSRASNAVYDNYPEVSYQQTPHKRMGGGMDIEEIVIYASKEECEQITNELSTNPEVIELSNQFMEIVQGEIKEEENGE